jgi:hypothetical protein
VVRSGLSPEPVFMQDVLEGCLKHRAVLGMHHVVEHLTAHHGLRYDTQASSYVLRALARGPTSRGVLNGLLRDQRRRMFPGKGRKPGMAITPMLLLEYFSATRKLSSSSGKLADRKITIDAIDTMYDEVKGNEYVPNSVLTSAVYGRIIATLLSAAHGGRGGRMMLAAAIKYFHVMVLDNVSPSVLIVAQLLEHMREHRNTWGVVETVKLHKALLEVRGYKYQPSMLRVLFDVFDFALFDEQQLSETPAALKAVIVEALREVMEVNQRLAAPLALVDEQQFSSADTYIQQAQRKARSR